MIEQTSYLQRHTNTSDDPKSDAVDTPTVNKITATSGSLHRVASVRKRETDKTLFYMQSYEASERTLHG